MATLIDKYLSRFDLDAIEAEVIRAEFLTEGEIAVEIASRSRNWLAERLSYAVGVAAISGSVVLLLTRDNNWGIYYDFTQTALWAALSFVITFFGLGKFLARATRRQKLVWFRAQERFGKLTPVKGLAGVLIFVSLEENEPALVADRGIATKVLPDFWQSLHASLAADMRAGNHAEGIVKTIRAVGQEMATHFPAQEGDDNRLPDKPTLID